MTRQDRQDIIIWLVLSLTIYAFAICIAIADPDGWAAWRVALVTWLPSMIGGIFCLAVFKGV